MIIYPAIDLRGGKVVRLKEGDPDQQTVFSDDPVTTAQRWIDEGASWLHMVNLDGAFSDENDNLDVLRRVAQLPVKVQFGGGLRSIEAVQQALDLGASRVILGTMAVQQPEVIGEAVGAFGAEAVCVALDAREGKITTHGWQQATTMTPLEFGQFVVDQGAIHALYTDVQRDGSLQGANVQATVDLARETGLQVIASGGVSSVIEIERLARSGVVAGAIIGMALYKGQLTMNQALKAARAGLDAG